MRSSYKTVLDNTPPPGPPPPPEARSRSTRAQYLFIDAYRATTAPPRPRSGMPSALSRPLKFGHFSNLIICFIHFADGICRKKSREWHHVWDDSRVRVAGVDLTNMAAGEGQGWDVPIFNHRFKSKRVNSLCRMWSSSSRRSAYPSCLTGWTGTRTLGSQETHIHNNQTVDWIYILKCGRFQPINKSTTVNVRWITSSNNDANVRRTLVVLLHPLSTWSI